MQILKPNEVKCLEQICALRQNELIKVMKKYLEKYYTSIISTSNYIIAIGDIPVGLVAHMDTVFPNPPKELYYDQKKNVMWSPIGAGFDDRAGIYAIIRLLKKGYKPSIILTTDEERGGLGADKLVTDKAEAPTDLKYLIELDRCGAKDCVFYDCNNPEFDTYIESFGFEMALGTFSDIGIICPAWGIAGVNLSIGYECEHSTSEHLFVHDMLATIAKVEQMLKDADNIEAFEYIPFENYVYSYQWDPSYGISKEEWDSWMNRTQQCAYCHYEDVEFNMIPVKLKDYGTIFLCPECAASHDFVHWCPSCGEAYIDMRYIGEDRLCEDCEAKINDNKGTI